MVDRPLQVCLDARMQHGRHGGIQHVVESLAQAFSNFHDDSERYRFLVRSVEEAQWLAPLYVRPLFLLLIDDDRHRGPGPVGRVVHAYAVGWAMGAGPAVGAKRPRANIEVVHLTIQQAFRTDLPHIYMPHDLLHRHCPHTLTREDLRYREYLYGWYCRHADVVVSSTEWGAADLTQAYGVPADRIAVEPLGSALGSLDEGGSPCCCFA